MVKKILLTGGTGLIGPDIAEELAKKSCEVYVLTRRVPRQYAANVKWIIEDMYNCSDKFFAELPEVDAVVHAGAAVRAASDEDEFSLYRRVNMEFSERLFRWCGASKNCTSVIYISTLNFLQKPLEKMIVETSPIAPTTLYGIGKFWGERALFHYAMSDVKYRAVSLRVSSPVAAVYGRLHDTVVKKWIGCALAKQAITVFGKGARTQDFVATSDVAQAVSKALFQNEVEGIYNIAAGTSISMLELAEVIAARLDGRIMHVGRDAYEEDRWNISIEKAKREMGYRPRYTSTDIVNKLLDSVI